MYCSQWFHRKCQAKRAATKLTEALWLVEGEGEDQEGVVQGKEGEASSMHYRRSGECEYGRCG